ncbi:Hypothetical protein FKW44_000192 [Caligus rogercresseyi]|uniref:Uncharacterized protein n=1 Tax=Caligus rogercresseyi TaxID=217165 RepID=A0A7T8KH42_CALRO|nr:Hypothetical protein FKW44_000192 [Caligus rogercresseyi]
MKATSTTDWSYLSLLKLQAGCNMSVFSSFSWVDYLELIHMAGVIKLDELEGLSDL